MTCKDCIHENVCVIIAFPEAFENTKWEKEHCDHFKNKADYAEVRHSRWENISGFDVCNICGTSPADWETKPNNPKGYLPYCHCCGAKMDGNNLSTIPTGSEGRDA